MGACNCTKNNVTVKADTEIILQPEKIEDITELPKIKKVQSEALNPSLSSSPSRGGGERLLKSENDLKSSECDLSNSHQEF